MRAQEKKPKPYAALRAMMALYGYDQIYTANRLKRSEAYFKARINGHKPWSQKDMYQLLDMFQIPHELIYNYFPNGGYVKGGATNEKAVELLNAQNPIPLSVG